MRRGRRAFDALFSLLTFAAALLCLLLVAGLGLFLALGALPVLRAQGFFALLCQTDWNPAQGRYGLLAMLCCSLAAGLGALGLALPVAALGAACVKNLFYPPLARLVQNAAALLCGLPSVLFGLLGMLGLLPALCRLLPMQTAGSGGASLLAALLLLAGMLLPALFLDCMAVLQAVGQRSDRASYALGATTVQTVLFCELPPLRRALAGIAAQGLGRALCETMAVLLVSGNVVRMPALFQSARLLAPGLVLEMGYATGEHRAALFAIGLLLLCVALPLDAAAGRSHQR